MRAGDLENKPYARYWKPDMRPLQAHAAQAVLRGPEAAELGFAHEQAGKLLEPGYLPLETGYTRLANGQVFVAVLTPMPGVSGEMIDWWFAWHGVEKERYKLWHPHAHVRAKFEIPLDDTPDLPNREKYVGNTCLVDEYIGCDYVQIAIKFQPPGDNYLDDSRFAQSNVSTAVCARVGSAGKPFNFGRIVHLIRETEHGCEMRSRFWLGDAEFATFSKHGVINRALGSRVIAKQVATQAMGRDLLVHCAMEMDHLANFLPDLYADYHPDT